MCEVLYEEIQDYFFTDQCSDADDSASGRSLRKGRAAAFPEIRQSMPKQVSRLMKHYLKTGMPESILQMR